MLSSEFFYHSQVSKFTNYELSLLSLVSFHWLGRAGNIDESESEPSLHSVTVRLFNVSCIMYLPISGL